MKRITFIETKDSVCIVVLVKWKILTILFVFVLVMQHFVVDILIIFTLNDHLFLSLTFLCAQLINTF